MDGGMIGLSDHIQLEGFKGLCPNLVSSHVFDQHGFLPLAPWWRSRAKKSSRSPLSSLPSCSVACFLVFLVSVLLYYS